jgi:hypothetical protein
MNHRDDNGAHVRGIFRRKRLFDLPERSPRQFGKACQDALANPVGMSDAPSHLNIREQAKIRGDALALGKEIRLEYVVKADTGAQCRRFEAINMTGLAPVAGERLRGDRRDQEEELFFARAEIHKKRELDALAFAEDEFARPFHIGNDVRRELKAERKCKAQRITTETTRRLRGE